MFILLYGCTTWTMTKCIEKKLDDNCTRMLRAILNKSSKQHPTKQQLYSHLQPISKTMQIRRTRYARYWWRSKNDLISDVLLLTPPYECTSVGRPARTYLLELCTNTWCSLKDLSETMDDRDGRRKRELKKSGQSARHDVWAGCNTKLIFKRRLVGLNSNFPFS